jgi:hypothetical protein
MQRKNEPDSMPTLAFHLARAQDRLQYSVMQSIPNHAGKTRNDFFNQPN